MLLEFSFKLISVINVSVEWVSFVKFSMDMIEIGI